MDAKGLILALRTDQPQAELRLLSADGHEYETYIWLAHRQLADTLLTEIRSLLQRHQTTFDDLSGIVVFQGPGSFTGLRIGISVANALAYGQSIPISGSSGERWVSEGLTNVLHRPTRQPIVPVYGAEAHITTPRK